MVYNAFQGKPLRATFQHLPRELHFVQSLTSHIFRQQVRPPWVYACVSFGLCNAEILYLVDLCLAYARNDHSNPQVWWSLPHAQDIQNLHHDLLPCFPTRCQRMP